MPPLQVGEEDSKVQKVGEFAPQKQKPKKSLCEEKPPR
jgi:hypothetical protein